MLKVIELFAGIGSQTQALKNIGIEHQVVAISEIDKYACMSYEAIHGKVNNMGDITKIEQLPQADLWTYSFPCQDISLAGLQKGLSKDGGTRSGLLWEVERLLKKAKENGTLPKYLLMENVKNLVSKKFIEDFKDWIKVLYNLGYVSFYDVLNAKDYGIPQNRERVFMVSILDQKAKFEFPQPFELKLRLKEMLENNVDENYYLSDSTIQRIVNWKAQQKPLETFLGQESITPTLTARGAGEEHSGMILLSEKFENETNVEQIIKDTDNYIQWQEEGKHECCCRAYKEDKISGTITTRYDEMKIVELGNYSPSGHNASRIDDINGIAPTIMDNHGTQTAIAIKNKTKQGYLIAEEEEEDGIDISQRMESHRGTVQKGISQTITTQANVGVFTNLRIRKLTPRECYRLMGFKDEQFDKASKVCSNSQLYKQAGNSIVVNVLEEIFKKMFLIDYSEPSSLLDFFD